MRQKPPTVGHRLFKTRVMIRPVSLGTTGG